MNYTLNHFVKYYTNFNIKRSSKFEINLRETAFSYLPHMAKRTQRRNQIVNNKYVLSLTHSVILSVSEGSGIKRIFSV